jgi:hypothetical protein
MLYAGTNFLWRHDDSAKPKPVWTPRLGNKQMARRDEYINFIAVAPGDSQRIYTGYCGAQVTTGCGRGP